MKLKKATIWARNWFEEGSVPASDTVKKWIEAHSVPGVIIDGIAYVDEAAWLELVCSNDEKSVVSPGPVTGHQLLMG